MPGMGGGAVIGLIAADLPGLEEPDDGFCLWPPVFVGIGDAPGAGFVEEAAVGIDAVADGGCGH